MIHLVLNFILILILNVILTTTYNRKNYYLGIRNKCYDMLNLKCFRIIDNLRYIIQCTILCTIYYTLWYTMYIVQYIIRFYTITVDNFNTMYGRQPLVDSSVHKFECWTLAINSLTEEKNETQELGIYMFTVTWPWLRM